LGIKERLNAETIPAAEKFMAIAVPYCKSKHPVKLLNALRAPTGVCGKNHFRIGVGAIGIVPQLCPQFSVVIDLAVEHDLQAPIGTTHRLLAGFAEIDDGQPTVTEPDLV
jgi:hypothetical protein